MSPSFPNLTKIMPGNPAYDTADVGKYVNARASCRVATWVASSSAAR